MQNRYAGDIGDYLKFALLRRVPKQRKFAVCWWLHPDEEHNGDGRHVGYLEQPDRWQTIDAELHDGLSRLVRTGLRSVHQIEKAGLSGAAHFHSDPVPTGKPRFTERTRWFDGLQHGVEGMEVLFLDPDNGIDLHPDASRRHSGKHVTLDEIAALARHGARSLIIYHHQTRAKGGHAAEIQRIICALEALGVGRVTAIRARPYSPRVFFILGRHDDVHEALTGFAAQFPDIYETHAAQPGEKTAGPNRERLGFTAIPLTLYPDMFPGPLGHSMAGRALEAGVWSCAPVQIRDFATDRHRTVDDTPAGGGAGMVLKADILAAALDHAVAANPGLPILAMTPRGAPVTQARVRDLAAGPGAIILCGRFEGFDERIFDARPIEQVSMGDIILSGGEMGALLLLDACIRLIPGVMGAPSSGDDESFENGLLEYPHYTRPVEWEGRMIPDVLRSGDHAKIAAWRRQRAAEDTRERRPDLWERYDLAGGGEGR